MTRRLAIAKYVQTSSPAAAWRHMVEEHLSAVAADAHKRLGRITTPAMVAQATLWQPQMTVMYQECKNMPMPAQVRGGWQGVAIVPDAATSARGLISLFAYIDRDFVNCWHCSALLRPTAVFCSLVTLRR